MGTSFREITKKINWQKIAISTLILIFFIQAGFFALKLTHSIQPDEGPHVAKSIIFSETLTRPENSSETYQYGDIEREPYLYYWISGRIININFLGIDELTLLRIFSVIMSTLTVYITFLISKEFTKDKLQQILTVALTTNTVMFVFLSGGANYDNMVNLLAALSFLFFLKIIKNRKTTDLLVLTILLLIGGLVKFTFVPLAVSVFAGFLFIERKNLQTHLKNFKSSFNKNRIKILFLTLFIVVLTILNIELHGVNIIRYHTIKPSCEQLMTKKQCSEYPIYIRNSELKEDAKDNPNRLPIPTYMGIWTKWMMTGMYGILGHKPLFKGDTTLFIQLSVFAAAGVLFIRKVKLTDKLELLFLSITTFYALIIMAFDYYLYLQRNAVYVSVQGRYLFPVIFPAYLVVSRYLMSPKNKKIKLALFLFAMSIILLENIPYLLTKLPYDWLI